MVVHLGWLALLIFIISVTVEITFRKEFVKLFGLEPDECSWFFAIGIFLVIILIFLHCLLGHNYIYINCENPTVEVQQINEKYDELMKVNKETETSQHLTTEDHQ